MRDILLDDALIVGALDIERSPTGVSPRRLPAWTRPQLPDDLSRVMVAMTAGVRLAFTTNSATVELDVLPSTFERPGAAERPIAFELVADGKVVDRQETTGGNKIRFDLSRNRFEIVDGDPVTVRFGALPPSTTAYELWLPHGSSVELQALRIDDDAELAPSATTTGPTRRRWVHHGSSISHCIESPTPTTTWPAIVALATGVDLLDLAFGGSCHLDQFVARTIRDEQADLISLKVGVNVINFDSLRERGFRPALHGFIDTVRDGHPDTPFLIASSIIFPVTEDTPGPTMADGLTGWRTVDASRESRMGSMTSARCREIVEEIVDQRRDAGDTNLHYLDGLELFGPDDVADLPDGLHPNARGYARIAERFRKHAFAPGGPFAEG